jgi:hypothetical protein
MLEFLVLLCCPGLDLDYSLAESKLTCRCVSCGDCSLMNQSQSVMYIVSTCEEKLSRVHNDGSSGGTLWCSQSVP